MFEVADAPMRTPFRAMPTDVSILVTPETPAVVRANPLFERTVVLLVIGHTAVLKAAWVV